MSIKRNRILFTIILQLTSVCLNTAFGQDPNTENGAFYLLTIQTKSENGRPISLTCIVKNIDELKVSRSNANSFVCSLFNTAIYIVSPPLRIERQLIDNYRVDRVELEKMLVAYYNDLKKLDKSKFAIKLNTSANETIWIDVVRFTGEVWHFKPTEEKLNNMSHQIKIPISCYLPDRYYMLKAVKEVSVLSRNDKDTLKAIFNAQR